MCSLCALSLQPSNIGLLCGTIGELRVAPRNLLAGHWTGPQGMWQERRRHTPHFLNLRVRLGLLQHDEHLLAARSRHQWPIFSLHMGK